jgi:hypothetical protein
VYRRAYTDMREQMCTHMGIQIKGFDHTRTDADAGTGTGTGTGTDVGAKVHLCGIQMPCGDAQKDWCHECMNADDEAGVMNA